MQDDKDHQNQPKVYPDSLTLSVQNLPQPVPQEPPALQQLNYPQPNEAYLGGSNVDPPSYFEAVNATDDEERRPAW